MLKNSITQPSVSVTDVKQSPMSIFERAKEKQTGVYVYNRKNVAGVMLSVEQYEALINKKTDKEEKNIQLNQLDQDIRQKVAFGSLMTTKNLDEQLAAIGFVSKKVGADSYAEIMNELNETGKIEYQFQKKEDRTNIFAEVIGEQSNQSNLSDKIIVKKIHVRVD